MRFRPSSGRISCRYLLEKYNLLDLSSTRLQIDAVLYDLCHNKYDCTALIGLLCRRVPHQAQQRQARPHQLFAIDPCRTIVIKWSTMVRLVVAYNKHFNAIDVIASTIESFKKQIL
ncbi:hypothetical protein EVAR_52798_1 [Eumeta japonica]|uniref:Uncharacterized protein n=1 Tax=Eumeta variegata TaxID=151549 RepID=A0A4C1Y7C4_EUMVA|nr:hypothetical protein EVAR_52798_1 [Eumeta japonica]